VRFPCFINTLLFDDSYQCNECSPGCSSVLMDGLSRRVPMSMQNVSMTKPSTLTIVGQLVKHHGNIENRLHLDLPYSVAYCDHFRGGCRGRCISRGIRCSVALCTRHPSWRPSYLDRSWRSSGNLWRGRHRRVDRSR
jgi:hypothetical protein